MAANPGDELVDVIDAEGRTVGTMPRRQMRAQRLPHRCVWVLVFNGRGELFVHLRTATKDLYPAHWDVTVGGVPAAGEGLDEAARREVGEELGVAVEPDALFPFAYADEYTVVQGMVYRVRHDGPFVLQTEEVVCGEFVALAEMAERTGRQPFCPDGVAVLREYRRRVEGGLAAP